jgi:hypothetical protein
VSLPGRCWPCSSALRRSVLSRDAHGPDSRIQAPVCCWQVDSPVVGTVSKTHLCTDTAKNRFSWLLCVWPLLYGVNQLVCASSAQCLLSIREHFSNPARQWPVFLVDDRQCILQCAICRQTLRNSSVLNESRTRLAENISSHGTTEDSAYDRLAEATRLNYLAIACIFFVPGEALCDLEAVNGKCADLELHYRSCE